jgi:hypothetical protein
MPPKPEVVLTRPIREALELRVRSRSSRADDARKARLILMLADGSTHWTTRTLAKHLGVSHMLVHRSTVTVH